MCAVDSTPETVQSLPITIGAAVSYMRLEDYRHDGDAELFDSVSEAREWAETQVREKVANDSSARDVRVDVARIDDWDDYGDWYVDRNHMIARAEWDAATATVAWQESGPFTWDY